MTSMQFIPLQAEDDNWAHQEMQGLVFNDKRLEDRLSIILQTLFAQPTESIPTACHSEAEIKATYGFLQNKKVSVQQILAPHLKQTLHRIRAQPVVLLLNDTSDLNFSEKKVAGQLGYIADNKTRGIFIHPLLAVTPERLPLGLVDLYTWLRTDLVERPRSADTIPLR